MLRQSILTSVVFLLSACGNQVALEGRQMPVTTAPASEDQVAETREQLLPDAPPVVETPVLEVPKPVLPVEKPMPPVESEKAVEPVLITGSHLISVNCSWPIQNIRLACVVQSSDKTAVLKASDFRMSMRHATNNAAIVLPSSNIKVQESGPQVTYNVNFPEPIKDLIVRFDLLGESMPQLIKEINAAEINLVIANVRLFEQANFMGPAKEFGIGKFTQVVSFPDFPRSFTSARIPPNMAIEICEELNTGRTCRKYYGDIANFTTLAGRINTVTVYTSMPFISAYLHANQVGVTSGNFGMGIHPLAAIDPALHNGITSFHIPANVLLRACNTPDGSSGCLDYFPGTIDAGVLSDAVRYMEVHPLHQ